MKATIKQMNGQPTITEATEADLRALIGDWDDPTAYGDAAGRICAYPTAEAYDDDMDGAYPEITISGPGAEALASDADIDIVCWM